MHCIGVSSGTGWQYSRDLTSPFLDHSKFTRPNALLQAHVERGLGGRGGRLAREEVLQGRRGALVAEDLVAQHAPQGVRHDGHRALKEERAARAGVRLLHQEAVNCVAWSAHALCIIKAVNHTSTGLHNPQTTSPENQGSGPQSASTGR